MAIFGTRPSSLPGGGIARSTGPGPTPAIPRRLPPRKTPRRHKHGPCMTSRLASAKPGARPGSLIPPLCRPAPCSPPAFDHAEHGPDGQERTRRPAHPFCSAKLGAGMTGSTAVQRDRTAAYAPALMEVAGVTKRYGEQRALADISFAVNPGEVLGLIGPNGAGKTTLLEAVAGLVPVDGGRILWRGTSPALPHHREF